MRRWIAVILSLSTLFALCSCWDYRGLDELTIVAGMAIDRDGYDPGQYLVTFEVIETKESSKDAGATSRLVQSKGHTLFEAVFNAGKQLYTEMYFGNTEILVISQQIASEEGVATIFESIMRDFDTRDTIMILISRENTAREIITPSEDSSEIISYSISEPLDDPHLGINTTKAYSVAHGYDVLKSDCAEMSHAAFSVEEDDQGNRIPTADGIGIFRDDKMVGFLEEEHIQPYLLTIEKVNDGIFAYMVDTPAFSNPSRVALNITFKQGSVTCELVDGKLVMGVDIQLRTHAVELTSNLLELDQSVIEQIAQAGNAAMEKELVDMFKSVRSDCQVDIFGFADALYRNHPEDWAQIKSDWDRYFMEGSFYATCDIVIRNAGLTTIF